MHNGMVETDAEKMSKSEGNIFQLSEALDRYGREAVVGVPGLRALPAAAGVRRRADGAGRGAGRAACGTSFGSIRWRESRGVPRWEPARRRRPGSARRLQVPIGDPRLSVEAFREALADDFNTPRAMAEVFELVGEANRGEIPGAAEAVREMLELVGLESLAEAGAGSWRREAEELLAEREEARAARDFDRADEIRDRLAELGWEVRDGAEGAQLVPKA